MKTHRGARLYKPGQKISVVDEQGNPINELLVLEDTEGECHDCFFGDHGSCKLCAKANRPDEKGIYFKSTGKKVKHLIKVLNDGTIYKIKEKTFVDNNTGTKLKLVADPENDPCKHCFYNNHCDCIDCIENYYFAVNES